MCHRFEPGDPAVLCFFADFEVASGSVAVSSEIATDGDSALAEAGPARAATLPLACAGGGEIELGLVAALLASELAAGAGDAAAAADDCDGEGVGDWASAGSSVGAAATGGSSTTGTLVTSACAAIDVFAASVAGR